MLYSPVAGSGSPALGFTMIGRSVQYRNSSTKGTSSSGPREQLIPNASTPSPVSVSAIAATVVPVKVRPEASKLIVVQTGSSLFSFAASTAAFTSYKSVMVSNMIRSAPHDAPALTTCA